MSTPSEAQALLRKSAEGWQACNGHAYSVESAGSTARWNMKSFDESGVTLRAVSAADNNPLWLCQHVLTVQTRYLIEALACGYDIADQARTITESIAAKLMKNLDSQ